MSTKFTFYIFYFMIFISKYSNKSKGIKDNYV